MSTHEPAEQEDVLTEPSQLVSPVVRAFRLLRYVADGGSTSNLSEVGRLIDVNRITVMRLIATLTHEGVLEALPQGGHRIGLDFLKLAAMAVSSDDLLGFGRRVLARLSADLNLSSYLATLDDGHVVYLLRDMPQTGLVTNVKVGSRVPAHLITPGCAMLAQRPDAAAHALTHVADPDQLQATLAQVRQRGCAWSFSGFEHGIDSCAAPVFGADGQAVAAISVAGPESAFQADTGIRERAEQSVKAAAAELSALLGHRSKT
jgi:DNA-binding IclR family transcriptional regulator